MEPLGANRDSPDPNPNATRKSEEQEDKYIISLVPTAYVTYTASGSPRRVARKDVGSMSPFLLASTFKTYLGLASSRTFKIWTSTRSSRTRMLSWPTSFHSYVSFYRSVQEREVLLATYNRIMKLILKLRNILEDQDNTDGSYFYNVIDVVRTNAHIYVI